MHKGPALLLEDVLLVLALTICYQHSRGLHFLICKTKENNTKFQVCYEDWK